MIEVIVVNESTVVSDEQVQQVMKALEMQANQDFAPKWGIDQVRLTFFPKGQPLPSSVWELVFADTSDQAGDLGYHETASNGQPIGFVFCKSDQQYGTSWSVTASHELLEMLADPWINLSAEVDNADGSITLYAREVSDACEADSLGYNIMIPSGEQILVSDFVLPTWFEPMNPGKQPTDFKGHISNPLQILSDGYIGVMHVATGATWEQKLGELVTKTAEQTIPSKLHRRGRRLSKAQWQRSER